jgi:hypothetical protein
MTFRDDVLEALLAEADDGGYDDVVGFRVPRRLLVVRRWAGHRPFSLPDDCRKEGSLLVDPDGQMSCIEVEVVRLLRARWQAGWVQGFACGWRRWSESIWKQPPDVVSAINERVQMARGQLRPSTHGGHPDVAVTDGDRVVYVECKMDDDLKPSQIEWFGEALRRAIVLPDQVLVVQGIDRDL